MTRRPAAVVLPLALVACLALSACPGGGEGGADSAARVDTTNQDQLDGVSNEQLQAEARAMTPEEAAARGMIDTTTHLEQLGSSDSAAGTADTAPPRIVGDDTTGRPPGDSAKRP